jgi:anthranilate synthase/aminodeoxychorismate synthase-like glutamine amidotransferase
MKVLLIDHEDSFVYNLYQALARRGPRVRCVRYTVPWAEVARFDPDAVVLSPGPGHPADERVTGLARRALRAWGPERPTLGVCLGHQLIGSFYGGSVRESGSPVHGETELVDHADKGILRGLPSPLRVARYHSLVLDPRRVPKSLDVTARTRSGRPRAIMAVQHRRHPVFGVQFHPESYLTERGDGILGRFLEEARR